MKSTSNRTSHGSQRDSSAEKRTAAAALSLAPLRTDARSRFDELRHDTNNLILPIRAHLNRVRFSVERSDSPMHARSLRAISDTIGFIQALIEISCDSGNQIEETCVHETDFHTWWQSRCGLLECVLPTNIRLKWKKPRKLPRIAIDPIRFTQAMLNLIANARDAMQRHSIQHGCITIEAKKHRSARRGACIQVNIRDNAGGMTAKVLGSVFKRRVTTKQRGMHGLGLQIVRDIIHEAQGTVEISSRLGAGTCISLFLPIATHTHELRFSASESDANSLPDRANNGTCEPKSEVRPQTPRRRLKVNT